VNEIRKFKILNIHDRLFKNRIFAKLLNWTIIENIVVTLQVNDEIKKEVKIFLSHPENTNKLNFMYFLTNKLEGLSQFPRNYKERYGNFHDKYIGVWGSQNVNIQTLIGEEVILK